MTLTICCGLWIAQAAWKLALTSASPTLQAELKIFLPMVNQRSGEIYRSHNLQGHSTFAECNPGGGTQCTCTQQDALLQSFRDYGAVTSNPSLQHTYVNALGYQKFTEAFPDQSPLYLSIFQYTGQFRLPKVPNPDVHQHENGQAIHLMIQLWDGRNELYPANQHTLEAVIYWRLNPWEPEFERIQVYTYPADLIDTGITLPVDTRWHSFSLVADFVHQKYISIRIDDQTADLRAVPLAAVNHATDFGPDISISITTESMATWPQQNCVYTFTWTTEFRNLVFSEIP